MPCYARGLRRTLGYALALMLLCSFTLAQSVSVSYAPGVDFSKYHTYKWVEVAGQPHDPTLDAQIKQSFDSQLAAKGLTKAVESADLDVDYQAALTKAEKWEVYEDWSDTGFGPSRMPQRRKVVIDVGTLVFDMYDTPEKALVWTGTVKKTVDVKASAKDRQKNLDKAAKQLFANYPPH